MNIEQIDQEISKQLELLKEKVKVTDLKEICEFKLTEAESKIPWENLKFKGIYLLEIKNSNRFDTFELWINDFKNEWEGENYKYKFTPNTKKIRIKAHKELKEWIPLYIGKSKNIDKRIHGHIYKELHKTTFALKLMARKNLIDHTFRLKVLEINVHNYDSIVPKVEWQLRNRINPIIGKQ
ncbi:hypothetical protein ACFQ3R_11505 [Mesonia ostreae]|uniref:Uncharacterized protein n=1 Tax=Mesonia ostreae TaxID=861110 RepID=A0ABU2KM95_9FLAO|nr:hypothetical protein [Mesonia ostreae]MDT0295825.1 hypothetical protein [Mesonia ostreae]